MGYFPTLRGAASENAQITSIETVPTGSFSQKRVVRERSGGRGTG